MQWDSGTNAGFSKGSPWLPVETGYQRYNFESEKEDSASIYSWYAKLLKLRHENPAFRDGSYVPLDSGNPNVFAFARNAGANEAALVILNTSPQEQHVRLSATRFRNVLMASPPASAPPSESFTIAPYGVLIASS